MKTEASIEFNPLASYCNRRRLGTKLPVLRDNNVVRHVVKRLARGDSVKKISVELDMPFHAVKSIAADPAVMVDAIPPTKCPGCNYKVIVTPCPICETRRFVVEMGRMKR